MWFLHKTKQTNETKLSLILGFFDCYPLSPHSLAHSFSLSSSLRVAWPTRKRAVTALIRAHRPTNRLARSSLSDPPLSLPPCSLFIPPHIFGTGSSVDKCNRSSQWGDAVVAFPPWRTVVPWKTRGWKRGWTTTWSSPIPTLSERRQGKNKKKITVERSVYVQPGVCDFAGLFSANKLFYVQPHRQSDSLC